MKGLRLLYIIAVVVLAVTRPFNHVYAANEIPFENLILLYNVNMPIMGAYPLSDFKGTIEFTFVGVTSKVSVVKIVADGVVFGSYERQKVKSNESTKCPVGVDTMLFLDDKTDVRRDANLNVTAIRLHVDSGQVYLGGSFSYEANSTVTTTAGKFDTYQLVNQMLVVSGPVSKFNVTTYLHYDKISRIMVYADMNARSGAYTYSYFMELKETNARLGGDASKCLIATAVYGSPLSEAVEGLRDFRDRVVLSSISGQTFLHMFNEWYYTFSPAIAEAQRKCEPFRMALRAAMIPMLAILMVAKCLYPLMPLNSEHRILALGLAASTVITWVYLSPVFVLVSFLRRKRSP